VKAGGLGLSKPILNVRVKGLPKQGEIEGVKVNRVSDWRENEWQTKANNVAVFLPAAVASELADKDSAAIVVGDEIRGVTAMVRRQWKQALEESHVVVKKLEVLSVKVDADKLAQDILAIARGEGYHREAGFGSWQVLANKLTDVRVFERYDLVRVHDWVKTNERAFYDEWSRLASRIGWNDAESWLLGDLPVNISYYNAIVTEQVKQAIANNVAISRVPRGRLLDIWNMVNFYVLEKMRFNNDIQELYRW